MTKARTLADLLDSSGDVKSSALDNTASSLSDLSVTATASELNTLDGITATTAELNYTDGVTSNIQTQINGITQATGNELENVSEDTSPSLGGNLDVAGNEITNATTNGDIVLSTGGTGNVKTKIGTKGSSLNPTALAFNRSVGDGEIYNSSSNAYQFNHNSNKLALQVYNSAGTQVTANALAVDAAGKIGIGSISPDGDLDIRNGTNQKLIIGNSGSYGGGEYGQLLFKESNTELAKVQWNGTGNEFEINNKVSTGTVSFKQNDTQRMQISSSGQVIVTGQGNDTSVRSTSSLMAAPNLVINGTSPPQMENKIVANGTTLNWFVEGFPQRYGNNSNSTFQTVTLTAMHIANNSTTTRDLFNLGFHKGWAWHLCEIEVWGVYYIGGYRKYMVRNHSSYSTPFLTQTESYGYMNATPSVTMSNNGRFLNGTRTSYTGSANDTSYYDQKLQLSMPAYSRSFTRVKFLGVADNAFRHGSDITNGRQVRLYQPV